jgi:hypothetical protein
MRDNCYTPKSKFGNEPINSIDEKKIYNSKLIVHFLVLFSS